jgi:hypothetical protein
VARIPLCVLSLDFKEAFDRIEHKDLFAILQSYGFSDAFVECIKHRYNNATSDVQINGHISAPIQIQCSVRQGCPLSMMLFALCLNPLIHRLEQKLNGIRVHRQQRSTAVVAYADAVTVLVTAPEEILAVREAVWCYEKATGAVLNTGKSQALAVGTWDTTRRVFDIPYSAETEVLGFRMKKTIAQSGVASWPRITNMVGTQAREAYSRDLNLAQLIQYVHTYLLGKLWHTAQVLPPQQQCIRQIISAMVWYIWQGTFFRVSLSTLQRRKDEGRWGLTDVEAKCRTLLITRMWTQSLREGSASAGLQQH